MADASSHLPGGQDILSADHRSAHLLAENLHCVLGDRVVLHDVSLKVSHGERVGLIGENGRGSPPCCAPWPVNSPRSAARWCAR